MINNIVRVLKLVVLLALAKLGYGLVKLSEQEQKRQEEEQERKRQEEEQEQKRQEEEQEQKRQEEEQEPTPEPERLIAQWFKSPVDQFLDAAYRAFRTGHFDVHYVDWRMRRIQKVLQIEGIDFSGKTILELGGGHGDIGAFFAELGANVISIDGRAENCQFANLKYSNLPTFKSIQRDIEKDFTHLGRFDLVVSFGSIEVLDGISEHIARICKVTDRVLCETIVLPSDNPEEEEHTEIGVTEELTADHTISGAFQRVSPPFIERAFADHGFTAERFFDSDLNSGFHVYDWEVGDELDEMAPRRFWRFTKRLS
jgi:SAM-dependent methyltransferase